MASVVRWSGWLLASSLLACGGAEKPAQGPEHGAVSAEEAPAPRPESSVEEAPLDEAGHEPGAPPTEADQLAEAERRRREQAPREREVLYKITPQGLVVQVDGVEFRPKAEPIKKPDGGYGIRVTVEAESTDDDTHVLLSPKHGPLAFAARISDKSGNERAKYGDEREGDEQQFIMPGGPLTFSREWPSGSVKGPLWWGQQVRLEVGLWGLGRANEKTRPLNKFFVVEMVGGAKAQAVISPPDVKK